MRFHEHFEFLFGGHSAVPLTLLVLQQMETNGGNGVQSADCHSTDLICCHGILIRLDCVSLRSPVLQCAKTEKICISTRKGHQIIPDAPAIKKSESINQISNMREGEYLP